MIFKNKNKSGPMIVDDRLKHIAFIMDGNGRWAQKKGMPREYGHKAGAAVFKKIIEYCSGIGLKAITVYALSTENYLNRPRNEINAILTLFNEYLMEALQNLSDRDIRIIFIGDRSPFDSETAALMKRAETESADNKKILNIAINYGGRAEIVNAVNRLIEAGAKTITEKDISENLYTVHCPPPDMIVRTGAELRLSNFLLWQSAYSELYFTKTLWPDFSEKDVDLAIEDFYSRKRRYGGVS